MIERYDIPEISSLFSLKNRYETFLKVELAATHAFSKLGVVPDSDYQKIKEKAVVHVDRINELEKITKHDVIAFTRSIDEKLGDEKRWFHYGLTSTDVVDTAESYIYKQASQILDKDLKALLTILKAKSVQYKNLACIGRTHGIHADITSFGLKFLRFYAELERARNRFINATNALCLTKIEGAVGNFAFVPYQVEQLMSKELKMPTPKIATQVLPRDLHQDYLNSLALIASTIEDISLEFRNLQRSEIDETAEYFAKGQKGSSAMPHKHNPISFENMTGLSRYVRGLANGFYENIFLYHERDISHSSYERMAFPDAIGITDYIVRRMARVLKGLIVNKKAIQKNIWLTKGVIFSQRALTLLIAKDVSREDAYDNIQRIAFSVYYGDENANFIEALKKDPFVSSKLTEKEIDDLADTSFYLCNIDYIYKRVFKK